MAIITAQNCPTLRYLNWKESLLKHPVFLRWKHDGKKDSKLPYLRFGFPSSEMATICKGAVEGWEHASDTFRHDIWTTSIEYGKAFEQATDSICRHRVELYNSLGPGFYCGTYIQATEDIPLCLLYDVILKDAKKEVREDGTEGVHILWDGVIMMVSGSELVAGACSNMEEGILFADAHPNLKKTFTEANGSVDAALIFEVLDNLVFRKFADVVIRDVRDRKRRPKELHKDDRLAVMATLPHEVKQYDINWFTETVRTAGFARKGYMAVRWKGPRGKQHPEIVPVKAAWVRGYTRKAKKPHTDITLKDMTQHENV